MSFERILLCFLVFAACATDARAEPRVALVIGNSAYTSIQSLANPRNDAELMAKTLEEVGFDVFKATDVDFQRMRSVIQTFGRKLKAAGKDAVGLIYYAGYGVQARGGNYLIPIGTDIRSGADFALSALSTEQVLAQMEVAGNALNLVILDACRNNPFAGRVRSGGGGLARIEAASGSLVAFSAAPGQAAKDGPGRNSPYTLALAEAIRQPGLAVEQVFKRVRVAVETMTGGAQTPWEESSLRGDFYFVPGSALAEVRDRTFPAAGDAVELAYWTSIRDSDSIAVFKDYLERWPEGVFAVPAEARLAELRKAARARRKAASAQVRRLEPPRQWWLDASGRGGGTAGIGIGGGKGGGPGPR